MSETIRRMLHHRSVRSYRDAVPSDELVADCVRAAQMASTSSHVQSYCLIRVREAERRARLSELCGGQAMVADAGAFFVICGDLRRHQLLARRAEHPHATNLEAFLVAAVDASLFAQNLALAFEDCGLGICYIGGLRNQLREVDALLRLPEGVLPLYGLCAGEPADRSATKPRLPLEAVLFEEAYPEDEALLNQIDAFDAVMANHYSQRGLVGRNWSQGILRKHEAARRGYLAAYYREKGAVLD